MHAIIYRSTRKKNFKEPQIKEMLFHARDANDNHDVTGCIFYASEQFIQLLEGKQATLETLYDNIKRDARHFQVETLFDGEIPKRLFRDWKMVFFDLSRKTEPLRANGIYYNTILADLLEDKMPNPVAVVLNSYVEQLQKT